MVKLRVNRNVHSHALACIHTSSNCLRLYGEKCIFVPSHPFFSPSDLEMPIQILRLIFVAIKCYVFGLMAQKYSILSTRRAFSSWYKDKFQGPVRRKREVRGTEGYTNEIEGEEEWVSLWHLRGYNRHFHDSSDSHSKKREEEGCAGWSSTFTRLSERESEPWIRFASRKRPLRYLPLKVVPYAVPALPLLRFSRAIQKSAFAYSFSLLSHAYLKIIEGNEIVSIQYIERIILIPKRYHKFTVVHSTDQIFSYLLTSVEDQKPLYRLLTI